MSSLLTIWNKNATLPETNKEMLEFLMPLAVLNVTPVGLKLSNLKSNYFSSPCNGPRSHYQGSSGGTEHTPGQQSIVKVEEGYAWGASSSVRAARWGTVHRIAGRTRCIRRSVRRDGPPKQLQEEARDTVDGNRGKRSMNNCHKNLIR